MSKFKKVFKKKHVFLAVIHVEGGVQALRNVRIAIDEGADGVFLINHSMPYIKLIAHYRTIRDIYPNFWMGLNCLDIGGAAVLQIPPSTLGLWVDNAGVGESAALSRDAIGFNQMRERSGWCGLYFGGVAFKYQQAVKNIALATRTAVNYVDIITTSGEKTGSPPDVDKICEMRKFAGKHPIAIASGMTPENVHEYKPYANCFLVSTGISDSFTQFNPRKVRAFGKSVAA